MSERLSSQKFDLIIIGGGAAGSFAAAQLSHYDPSLKVLLLEKGPQYLSKVRISGGGRCNVTHYCLDPKELVHYYPRGQRELLGPFHLFGPSETIEWFENKGVKLKVEADGRMFPVTDNSQSIINCLHKACEHNENLSMLSRCGVLEISLNDTLWKVSTNQGEFVSHKLLICTGSSPQVWGVLRSLGLRIIEPVPSLFTFNCRDVLLKDLMGLSFSNVELKFDGIKFISSGPLLITHWGLSGPAVLKLSSWAARELAEKNYNALLHVDFLPNMNEGELREHLLNLKQIHARKRVLSTCGAIVPSAFWNRVVDILGLNERNWADLRKDETNAILQILKFSRLKIEGKSTFKDEFVTAGGVDLREISFKDMSSKKYPNLFLAGEVLNIDALTGGFNFQAAWTTAHLAVQGIVSNQAKINK